MGFFISKLDFSIYLLYNLGMEYTKLFSEIGKGDVSATGGKGASLGEMTQAGIPVPTGFVILSSVFDKFLEDNNLLAEINSLLSKVKIEATHTIENASEEIQSLILNANINDGIGSEIIKAYRNLNTKLVAVRSSATAEDGINNAWAGQLDSFLNTDESNLLLNVKKCWASLYTSRAIFYRFENHPTYFDNLNNSHIGVAVVVQQMVAAECAGVAFSVHPVTEDRNQIIIEAAYGLGDKLVSGEVTPDSYVVRKDTKEIIDIKINGNVQVLNQNQIIELAELIIRIENHYGFSCDIEWAYADHQFYIVQSRPITTLTNKVLKSDVLRDFKYEEGLLKRFMTREYSVAMFSIWVKDLYHHLFWYSNMHKMLILSEGDNNRVAGVYYLDKDIVDVYDALEKWINNNTDLYYQIVNDFEVKSASLRRLIYELDKEASHEKAVKFIKEYESWYYTNVSLFYCLPDMHNIPNDIREHSLKIRESVQDLDSGFSKILETALSKVYFEKYQNLIWYMLPNEIINNLSIDEDLASKLNLRKEKGWYFLGEDFTADKSSHLQSIEEKNLNIKYFDDSTSSEIIKGNTAYPGYVYGKLRIVKSSKDLHSLNNGEILVVAQTNPDYLPAMKRCAAIITDEGGITCHAAIVARELKKPCIIGTKVATQVLHDGDLVEVDADNGVVRVIERADETKVKNK